METKIGRDTLPTARICQLSMTVGPAAASPAATLFDPTDNAEDGGLKVKV